MEAYSCASVCVCFGLGGTQTCDARVRLGDSHVAGKLEPDARRDVEGVENLHQRCSAGDNVQQRPDIRL